MPVNLSFVVVTFNRLPFLKITLERLIAERLSDEEIVVVDGGSVDGTVEYLEQLFSEGEIQQFISEKDKSQAHGWNKAMLLASGEIIKKIIDDDAFGYTAIRACKKFMLENPSVDVVISNDLSGRLDDYKNIGKASRLPWFEKWKEGLIPSFTFGDVHLLIRKTSLAYIGLYNTMFVFMDWEFSLRISYLQANIAYYTGYNALSVAHPNTISAKKNHELIAAQGKKGEMMYDYKGDAAEIGFWSTLKILGGKILKRPARSVTKSTAPAQNIDEAYNYFYSFINELNENGGFLFIKKS